MELDRIDLPVELIEARLKQVINYGDYGLLSQEVLRQWSAQAVWTAAPAGSDIERLLNLHVGGLNSPGRTNPIVISFIRRYLEVSAHRLALFEDAVAKAHDLPDAGSKSPYAIVEGKVFPFLAGGNHEKTEVEDLVLESYSWRLVGVLTASTTRPVEHELGSSLEELVTRSRHVIMGAWDGEGLLVVDR